jgi:hypothetical protein
VSVGECDEFDVAGVSLIWADIVVFGDEDCVFGVLTDGVSDETIESESGSD